MCGFFLIVRAPASQNNQAVGKDVRGEATKHSLLLRSEGPDSRCFFSAKPKPVSRVQSVSAVARDVL